MIKNNILGNRLNKFKSGETITKESKSEDVIIKTSSDVVNSELKPGETIPGDISNKSLAYQISYMLMLAAEPVFMFGIKSIIYGLSINIIFSMGWEFSALSVVGMGIELITSQFFNIFKKNS